MTPPPLRILLADGSAHRANTFRIVGGSYAFRVVRTLADLEKTLSEEACWDLLIHTLYLGSWKNGETESIPAIVKAWKAGKLKNGVVCTTTVVSDAKTFLNYLRAQGIPGLYYPYSYTTPAAHPDKTSDLSLGDFHV